MLPELTNKEKIEILNKRMHALACAKYDIELAIMEANIVNYPDAANLQNLNLQISDINLKISAIQNLLSEIDSEEI